MENLKNRIQSNEGALGTVEMVVILGIVVVMAVTVFNTISRAVGRKNEAIKNCIDNPNGPGCEDSLNTAKPGR